MYKYYLEKQLCLINFISSSPFFLKKETKKTTTILFFLSGPFIVINYKHAFNQD